MSREIKFRAWDKSKKSMITEMIGFVIDSNKKRFRYFRISKSQKNGMGTAVTDLKNIVLMQFTGKKDKNSKEIYENDIGNILGRCRCVCIWDEKDASFVWWEYENGKPINAGQILMDDTQNDEVIGNEFENPKLIL